ncbi:MAG: hypothetical protein RJP95_04175 [Pirellulales bacterium]
MDIAVVVLASSMLTVVLVSILLRERRLRVALQHLLSRVLGQGRSYERNAESPPVEPDVATGDRRRHRWMQQPGRAGSSDGYRHDRGTSWPE